MSYSSWYSWLVIGKDSLHGGQRTSLKLTCKLLLHSYSHTAPRPFLIDNRDADFGMLVDGKYSVIGKMDLNIFLLLLMSTILVKLEYHSSIEGYRMIRRCDEILMKNLTRDTHWLSSCSLICRSDWLVAEILTRAHAMRLITSHEVVTGICHSSATI